MSEPTPPKASLHHGYRSWTSTYRDLQGKSHSKRWGRVGKVTRAQAIAKWRRWLDSEYAKVKAAQDAPPAKYSVEQLGRDFYAQANKGYHVNGKPTTTITRMRIAIESFAGLYGSEEADAMTAGKIALWLESFAAEKLTPRGEKRAGNRTKHTVNLALSYIKRMFRWGMTYKGVSSAATGSVVLVGNLRADHPGLRRKERIKSASEADFNACCDKAETGLRALLQFMWWTGARPGEAMNLRPCDIDMGRDVWVYTPAHHKNQWRGKQRFIAIGPRARAVIEPILPSKTDAPVFTRHDGKQFDTQKLSRRIFIACKAAGVPAFQPNQIRHSFATRVRLAQGAMAVTDLLGHAQINQQAVYLDSTTERAISLAKEVG